MTPQRQLFKHNPPVSFGDCHRACLASLLDLDRDTVPNFGEHYDDNARFQLETHKWLATQGLDYIDIAFNDTLENVLLTMKGLNPNAYYILGGTSRNGTGHSVIGRGGEIVWDPATGADHSIVDVMSDGMYWITYLVPLFMTRGCHAA